MERESWWTPSRLVTAGAVVLLGVVPAIAFRGPAKGVLEGRVTMAGKPVVVGTVVVVGADGAARSAALDAEGRYAVPGVPPGPARVGVISRDPVRAVQKRQRLAARSDRLTAADVGDTAAGSRAAWFAVPGQYEDPRGSGLQTVVAGRTTFDVSLK